LIKFPYFRTCAILVILQLKPLHKH